MKRIKGNILEKTTALFQAGVLTRPVWYDVVKMIPPTVTNNIPKIRMRDFPEKKLLDEFFNQNPLLRTQQVSLTDETPSIGHRFAQRQLEIINRDRIPAEAAYKKTMSEMRGEIRAFTTNLLEDNLTLWHLLKKINKLLASAFIEDEVDDESEDVAQEAQGLIAELEKFKHSPPMDLEALEFLRNLFAFARANTQVNYLTYDWKSSTTIADLLREYTKIPPKSADRTATPTTTTTSSYKPSKNAHIAGIETSFADISHGIEQTLRAGRELHDNVLSVHQDAAFRAARQFRRHLERMNLSFSLVPRQSMEPSDEFPTDEELARREKELQGEDSVVSVDQPLPEKIPYLVKRNLALNTVNTKQMHDEAMHFRGSLENWLIKLRESSGSKTGAQNVGKSTHAASKAAQQRKANKKRDT